MNRHKKRSTFRRRAPKVVHSNATRTSARNRNRAYRAMMEAARSAMFKRKAK